MRLNFDEQLDELRRELALMGALCEEAIAASAQAALTGGAEEPRKKASQLEEQTDRQEREIESLCMSLLLRQQPVAKDLRVVSSALKMVSDMERIGDQASDIAELSPYIAGMSGAHMGKLRKMACETIKMVTDSVESFVKNDVNAAKAVIEYDDVVDGLFLDIKREVVALIAACPEMGEAYVDTLMVAKYFERIGDHATNIAEWVEYSITGQKKQ